MMRVVVTGSRKWKNVQMIDSILGQLWHQSPNDFTLVHGAARGADLISHEWALSVNMNHGFQAVCIEDHPAQWQICDPAFCPPDHQIPRYDGTSYCPTAGHRRNQKMIDPGADICVAFLLNGLANKGTTDCINRATKNNIPVYKYWD